MFHAKAITLIARREHAIYSDRDYSIFIAPSKPCAIGFAHSPLLERPLACRGTLCDVTYTNPVISVTANVPAPSHERR